MAFGSFNQGPAAPMAEPNTTPLVDVMLVLLVVFIITTPLLTNAVQVDLPRAQAAASAAKPEQIRLAVRADGKMFWNDLPVAETDLPARFADAAAAHPNVELHLSADQAVRYESVAKTLAAAQQNGVLRIAFVTAAP
ncbi:ExbD/TolR family protein [Chromobacterium alticapitis]|uniref:Biopolymer transporter ExbD n=1 Tax=Chromobacterium alticapitis TaxID=2073169 RepID=A0A2S5DKQ1_9NEIS|nr:biopolymer transporter ExbD [Chromobacterium alticapitis]POZ63626.1 biopolymer transporter ExbD [Chromobacterium alticapitis]